MIKNLKNKRIGILMGGWSSEREISLRSGENVFQSLKKQGFKAVKIDINYNFAVQIKKAKIDIAFIALHGKPGEDGTIQGFLELINIPYTGSDVAASAIGMDKIMSKRLFQCAKIPTPKYIFLPKNCPINFIIKKEQIKFPVIVKPRSEGSSVGCVVVDKPSALLKTCQKAQKKFGDIFIEEFIDGMIATVGILGQQVLPALQLVPKKQRFYDFKAKYTKGETEFIIPARLAKPLSKKIQTLALAAHNIVGAKGFSRVDLVIKHNKPYFLEINTLPGMTELSDLPAQARHIGISYDQLVQEILQSAYK
jgi:D-alanine-D-alanine ligase